MFGNVTALEGDREVQGQSMMQTGDREVQGQSMMHTCSRYAAWELHKKERVPTPDGRKVRNALGTTHILPGRIFLLCCFFRSGLLRLIPVVNRTMECHFHQKSTCLHAINFGALRGKQLVTLPPGS